MNFWTRIFLVLAALLTLVTFAITLSNTYDYFSNTKVIKVYEERVNKINQRSKRDRLVIKEVGVNKENLEKLKQDLDFFSVVIEKAMFPLPVVLSQIEKVKPDKINIRSLVFSQKLDTVKISGDSAHVGAVSNFIIDLEKSIHFKVQLSKEEIRENKIIAFELIARWVGGNNG